MTSSHSVSKRRLSDKNLLQAELWYVDPENTIPSLNRSQPDPNLNPVIIGYYNERPPGGREANPDYPYVWCCHCGYPTHWDGRVIRDDSGGIFLIGADCGRRHYGESFINVERAFREERMRQGLLKRWSQMLLSHSDKLDHIKHILANSFLANHDSKHAELRRACPDGLGRLASAVRIGQLIDHVRVRDYVAEELRHQHYEEALLTFRNLPADERRRRRREGLEPKEDSSPIYRVEDVPLGLVSGASLIFDERVRSTAVKLKKELENAQKINLEGTDKTSTAKLGKVLKEIFDLMQNLREEIAKTSAAAQFFTPDNLNRLERWSAGFRNFRYTRDGDSLIVWDEARGSSLIRPIPIDGLALFAEFKDLF